MVSTVAFDTGQCISRGKQHELTGSLSSQQWEAVPHSPWRRPRRVFHLVLLLPAEVQHGTQLASLPDVRWAALPED